MFLKLAQLPTPLTALCLLRAPNTNLVQRTTQSDVWKDRKLLAIARRTRLLVGLNSLDAHSTEGVSTAGHLMRLTKHQQADRTLGLDSSWRMLHKLAVKPNLSLLSS